MLGWHPDSPGSRVAPRLMGLAIESYQESVDRNPLYLGWVQDYPQLGAHQLAAA